MGAMDILSVAGPARGLPMNARLPLLPGLSRGGEAEREGPARPGEGGEGAAPACRGQGGDVRAGEGDGTFWGQERRIEGKSLSRRLFGGGQQDSGSLVDGSHSRAVTGVGRQGAPDGSADGDGDAKEEEFGDPSGLDRLPGRLASVVGHANEVAVGVEDASAAFSALQVSGQGH